MLLENECPDIVAFTETWLHSDILDGAVTFDGYWMFRLIDLPKGMGVFCSYTDHI